jgi:diacylglycerol kinase family enzyme
MGERDGPFCLVVNPAAGRGRSLRVPREVTALLVGRDLPAAADGETRPCAAPLHPGTPLRIRAIPRALRVLVPGGLSQRASPRPAPPPG